ncbi:MAG: hypothetical protein C5B57_05290 [Blastocatellia bacterium]|nr:MAG: hypothetical protein C5B57_05290 [Blastocatellia bacterium]
MAEALASAATAPVAPTGLLARAVGVLVAPRRTYAAIAAHPRVVGALLLSLAIMITGTLVFLSTEVGQQAVIDQQVHQAESFGRPMNDAQYEQLERFAPYLAYVGAGFQVVAVVLGSLIMAGLSWLVFNALLGGEAKFKEVYAVVAHSGFVLAAAPLFVLPLDYVRESLTSPTSLAVFLPFLEENTFLYRLLGTLDLFYIWWIVNLAIGLGVLSRRRTGPIAATLLIIYAVLAVIGAAVRTALAGA